MAEKKIKILFIHTYYKQRGGEDHAFESEVALFKDRGYDVEVLTFANRHNSILKFLFFPFNVLSYLKTHTTIRRYSPSVVHVHNLFFAASPSILYAIKRNKIPCVLTVHNFRFFCPSGTLFNKNNIYTKSIGTTFPWQAIRDKVYNGFTASTFLVAFSFWLHKRLKSWNHIDVLIFLNKYAKDLFKETDPISYNNKIIVKANATEDLRIEKIQRGDAFLFVGRLSREKGLFFLLDAFSKSRQTLFVIGDGPFKEKVISASEKHPNIKYLGYQQKEMIVEQLNKCGALVLGSGCMEMAPLTVIEAMACGTPVIAPDIITLHGFILEGYNGLFYEFNNLNSFNDAIERFNGLTDVEKTVMGQNARCYYEQNFTQQASYEVLKGIYHDLLTDNKNPEIINALEVA
jgi:glycosyltransferase involved in cell wall biosynthesis